MKTFAALLLLFTLSLAYTPLTAQCSKEILADCKSQIKEGDIVLGAYNVDFAKLNTYTYQIGLRRDTKYRFIIGYQDNTNPTPTMSIELAGQKILSSNSNNRHYKTIDFDCKETHGYTLLLEGRSACMVLIITAKSE